MATKPTEAIQESPEVELDLPGVGKIKALPFRYPFGGECHGMSVDYPLVMTKIAIENGNL